MKSFFIVVVLMLRNGGAQTRIGGAPRAKESIVIMYSRFVFLNKLEVPILIQMIFISLLQIYALCISLL